MLVIRHIAALYPCEEKGEAPLLDAWIEIADGRVRALGTEPYTGQAQETIDARGKMAIPGLINMHHHFFQSLTRVIPAGMYGHVVPWLTVMYPLWQEFDPQAMHAACQLTAAELLLTGCTTSIDHAYLYPNEQHDLLDVEIDAVRPLGLRLHAIRSAAPRLEGAIGRYLSSDERLARIPLVESDDAIAAACERAIERHHDASPDSRVRIGVGPTQVTYDNPGLLERIHAIATAADCDRHTHVTPQHLDVEVCARLYGVRPTEYLRRFGWLTAKSVLAHCTRHTADDISSLVGTGAAVVHCPSQNIRLGTPVGPIPEMVKAGVPVVLGVDGAASNDGGGLLTEMRQALLLHRLEGVHDDYPPSEWLRPADILWMATRGGAEVLQRPELGHLAPGKAADIVLIDLAQVAYAGGLHDPLACIMMSGNTALVDTTMVGGEVLVERGALRNASGRRIVGDGNREAARLVRQCQARTGLQLGSLADRLEHLV